MISLLFIKASLLILIALGVTLALRSASAAVRSACWTAAAAVLLALPVAARYAPRVSVEVPVTREVPPVTPAAPSAGVVADGARVGVAAPLVLAGLWLAGAAALLGSFGVGAIRARGILLRSTPVNDASAIAIRLRVLVSNVHMTRRVHVATSTEVGVPLTGGLVRPYIILPESSATWDAARIQSVLVHEMAHIARWDYAAHVMFEVVRALYWPNPLVWRAMARATTERERAADDRVLAGGANPARYAADLLDFASNVRQPMQRAALGIAGSALKTRIRAILRSGTCREHATPRQLVTIAAAASVGLVPVAGLTFGARDVTIQSAPLVAADIVAAQLVEVPLSRQVIARQSDRYVVTRSVGSARGDSLLFVLINATQPGQRRAAARSLQADGSELPVVEVLISALSDNCHADRWLATRALRELRAKQALPNLVKQLVEDKHVAVRSMAANAIATAGVSEGAALLETALAGAETAQVARVTRALDTLGETAAHAQLISAVRRANH